jgi:hypothetical protein
MLDRGKKTHSEKKSLNPDIFLVMSEKIQRATIRAVTGKNILTSQDRSDNQNGKQVLFVYNSKCGSTVAGSGA